MSADRLIDAQLKDQALRHGLVGFEPTRDAFLGDEHEAERRAEAERAAMDCDDRGPAQLVAHERVRHRRRRAGRGRRAKAARSRRVRERGRARGRRRGRAEAALAERGMKAGGTLAERAARLFEAKGVSDLSALPRALVAKRKASRRARRQRAAQPRGPLRSSPARRGDRARRDCRRTKGRPIQFESAAQAPRYDMTAHKFAAIARARTCSWSHARGRESESSTTLAMAAGSRRARSAPCGEVVVCRRLAVSAAPCARPCDGAEAPARRCSRARYVTRADLRDEELKRAGATGVRLAARVEPRDRDPDAADARAVERAAADRPASEARANWSSATACDRPIASRGPELVLEGRRGRRRART